MIKEKINEIHENVKSELKKCDNSWIEFFSREVDTCRIK
jgi:hypothetical protein